MATFSRELEMLRLAAMHLAGKPRLSNARAQAPLLCPVRLLSLGLDIAVTGQNPCAGAFAPRCQLASHSANACIHRRLHGRTTRSVKRPFYRLTPSASDILVVKRIATVAPIHTYIEMLTAIATLGYRRLNR